MFAFLPFLLTFSLLTPTSATAQDMTIGFVEPAVILERMPELRAVQQRLQNFASRKEQELTELQRNFRTEVETYQQRVSVISDAVREREEERLARMQMELQQSQMLFEQEIQQRRAELMAPLMEQIQNAINEVAIQRGIDYVVNARTFTNDVIVLYVRESIRSQYDLTDAVMRNLGI